MPLRVSSWPLALRRNIPKFVVDAILAIAETSLSCMRTRHHLYACTTHKSSIVHMHKTHTHTHTRTHAHLFCVKASLACDSTKYMHRCIVLRLKTTSIVHRTFPNQTAGPTSLHGGRLALLCGNLAQRAFLPNVAIVHIQNGRGLRIHPNGQLDEPPCAPRQSLDLQACIQGDI
jgi:hypothetical protein